jgi:hypothetical protein
LDTGRHDVKKATKKSGRKNHPVQPVVSVGGFGELTFTSDRVYSKAMKRAAKLTEKK